MHTVRSFKAELLQNLKGLPRIPYSTLQTSQMARSCVRKLHCTNYGTVCDKRTVVGEWNHVGISNGKAQQHQCGEERVMLLTCQSAPKTTVGWCKSQASKIETKWSDCSLRRGHPFVILSAVAHYFQRCAGLQVTLQRGIQILSRATLEKFAVLIMSRCSLPLEARSN